MKILRFASYFHRLMRRNKQSLVVQSAARLCFYFFAMEILISLCYTIAMQRKTVCGCRLSSEKIAPFFAKPLDTLPAAPIMLLATGYWLLATGYWLLATGYWLLATGYWLRANSALCGFAPHTLPKAA
ncbi:MAG: hypothetical protein IJ158_00305 [Treponema sp.]|nr:hypothetical protein [Treponema sp.]